MNEEEIDYWLKRYSKSIERQRKEDQQYAPEIPPPMLDAATAAILASHGIANPPLELRATNRWWIGAGEDAKAALEAAGVAKMAARIAELEAELVRVREVLHDQTSYLEGRLCNAMTGEGCPHGCVRPSQCVDCIRERG